jgi:hypothetical protein
MSLKPGFHNLSGICARREVMAGPLGGRIWMCSMASVENSVIELCVACLKGRIGALQGVAKSAHV